MLFNSVSFLVFLLIVYLVYWNIRSDDLKYQNTWLFAASYFFYGYWNCYLLILIVISSFIDYYLGLKMHEENEPRKRKLYLYASLISNLGMLGFFKYFNFFTASFHDLLTMMGFHASIKTLDIILPVGISFYTFQAMSYTIDIYRREFKPTRSMINFFTYVCFFPQLVAGPIERAVNLLPQFEIRRVFRLENMKNGLRIMLWGLFKKIVIADNLSVHVDHIFDNFASLDWLSLIAGAYLFGVQIYCDFSAYSDIAVGAAELFGFRLCRNFNYPYFSQSIQEFWKRWHISLSTWFRDYVYIPLGGSRTGGRYRNILATFTLSGLWHGANWTFIAWGAIHGISYFASIALQKLYGSLKNRYIILFLNSLTTLTIVFVSWIFFRCDTLSDSFLYIYNICSFSSSLQSYVPKKLILMTLFFFSAEFFSRNRMHPLQDVSKLPVYARWMIYYIFSIIIIYNYRADYTPFIYFQF